MDEANRQGAVYEIKLSDCQASYISETGRNLNTRLTEHKQATRNGDANNHIAVHPQMTSNNIDSDSAHHTDSVKLVHNLKQAPLNRRQQLRPLTNNLSTTKTKRTNGLLTERF